MSVDEQRNEAELNAEIDQKLAAGATAKKAKRMVVDRFTSMIDKDPEKAMNTIRALLRKE